MFTHIRRFLKVLCCAKKCKTLLDAIQHAIAEVILPQLSMCKNAFFMLIS